MDNERLWLLVEGEERVAIANVYMATQTGKSTIYKEWNKALYAMLSEEINILRESGFKVILQGDFNARFGRMEGKIKGNYPDINVNGHLVLSFIEEQYLKVLNQLGDQSKVFTRREYEYGSIKTQSCLDLVLSDNSLEVSNWKFKVWDEEEVGIQSDHSIIELEMIIGGLMEKNKKPNKVKYDLSEQTEYKEYKD